jgi:4-hydroxybenzoate polyprenyltransferase
MPANAAPTPPATALAITSAAAAVVVLLGMTFAPAAQWLWWAYLAMIATAVLAIISALGKWQHRRAKRAAILAAIVLVLAAGLATWGGAGSETVTLPS